MTNRMFEFAVDNLSGLEVTVAGLPAPQVTVLLTMKGNLFVAENDVDGAICAELMAKNDTQIDKSLTVWKDGQIDLPSYLFRQRLIALNERNRNTEIFLQGKDGIIIKKLHQLQ